MGTVIVTRPVLALDLLHGHGLLDNVLYGYLLSLAHARKVPGLVGGPPCRSFGLRRHFVPGVQSALERDGAGRFGKVRLEASDERLVKREFTLFGTLLRHFWHLLDKTANQCAGRCCDPLFLF